MTPSNFKVLSPKWTGVACALLLAGSALAQNYSIDWYTVDGGGGTSAGGGFAITGSIGQPDAGTLAGGNFTLTGGFWSVYAAVQNSPAPLLTVLVTNANTVCSVYWPLPDNGWQLQFTASLSTTPVVWTDIPPPYGNNGTSLFHSEPVVPGNKFFRLYKP